MAGGKELVTRTQKRVAGSKHKHLDSNNAALEKGVLGCLLWVFPQLTANMPLHGFLTRAAAVSGMAFQTHLSLPTVN